MSRFDRRTCTRLTDRHYLFFRPGGGIFLVRETDGDTAEMASGDLVRIVRQREDPAFAETLDAMVSGDNGVRTEDLEGGLDGSAPE